MADEGILYPVLPRLLKDLVVVECSKIVRKITSENIISSKNKPVTEQGTKFGTYAAAVSTEVKVCRNKNSDSVSVGLNEK